MLKGGADGDSIVFCHHEHAQEVISRYVASKRCVGQARIMLLRGVAWLKHLLPMTRRDRARLGNLDATRAGMAIVADLIRDVAARQDAHAHAIQQAARASHGALTEAGDPNSIRNIFLAQATDAAVRSKQTAEALDNAVEALERLAAALRDD